jgi:hypothetical protein
MWIFRSFPQENEKNNRATMVSVKLISVALTPENEKREVYRGRS